MKIIDLTHKITETMPVYPGTEPPKLVLANTYEKDGFKETLISMFSHTGTHMDAPAHIFSGRTTLDAFDASQFVGSAALIDCTSLGSGDRIGMEFIEKAGDAAATAEFLVFHTGWDKKWGKEDYFGDYPCITSEVADYIISSGKKGVCLDTIGLDPIADQNLTLHKKLFSSAETVIVENLNGLERIASPLFTLAVLPLKYENADGSPVRAIAILE